MIMILTHRAEMRDQLQGYLEERNYEVCVPPHRDDVRGLMASKRPACIILDLYLSEPSGTSMLKTLRDDGYAGGIVILSGPSMTSVLKDTYPSGIDDVMLAPAEIAGKFDFGQIGVALEHNSALKAARQRFNRADGAP